jgi:hypothetical protein
MRSAVRDTDCTDVDPGPMTNWRNSESELQTDLPVKGLFFSEEAENVTFRPPVASKQTKQILNLKISKWLKIALK